MTSIVLTGKQIQAFVAALDSAFAPNEFDAMLQYYLDKKRHNFSMADDFLERLRETINKFQSRGWTSRLIDAALSANPDNPDLKAFARGIALNPVPVADAANLQKVITERSIFKNATDFVNQMTDRINWTCRIGIPDSGGSGVLVADDLVLTNYHVLEGLISKTLQGSEISCIFDYRKLNDGTELSSGRSVALHADGVIAWQPYSPTDITPEGGEPASDALDYAIVRLAEAVGDQPVGANGATNGAPQKRGHLSISAQAPLVEKDDPFLVLQHPLLPDRTVQEPVQLALGEVLDSPFKKLRVRHNARTLGGSSGSPCFNANMEMVALHHAGDPRQRWERPAWNQAIPIRNIIADLGRKSVQKFWRD